MGFYPVSGHVKAPGDVSFSSAVSSRAPANAEKLLLCPDKKPSPLESLFGWILRVMGLDEQLREEVMSRTSELCAEKPITPPASPVRSGPDTSSKSKDRHGTKPGKKTGKAKEISSDRARRRFHEEMAQN